MTSIITSNATEPGLDMPNKASTLQSLITENRWLKQQLSEALEKNKHITKKNKNAQEKVNSIIQRLAKEIKKEA
jgi:hypothetical protein